MDIEKGNQLYTDLTNNKKLKKHARRSSGSFSKAANKLRKAKNKKKALTSTSFKRNVKRGVKEAGKAHHAYHHPPRRKRKFIAIAAAATILTALVILNKNDD